MQQEYTSLFCRIKDRIYFAYVTRQMFTVPEL